MKNEYETGKKKKVVKVFGTYVVLMLLLTFFSKSFYNYRLPVVTVSVPKQGKLDFTVTQNAQICYAQQKFVYAEFDGRVRELRAKSGDAVKEGQCLMKYEDALTGELVEISAQEDGIITAIGVKEGMYVNSMQNTILYSQAFVSNEWIVNVFLTEEQMEYIDTDSFVNVESKKQTEGFDAHIESFVSYADQNQSGYQAQIIIPSENPEIAGERVKVTLRAESKLYDAIIPKAALRKDTSGYFVLALKKEDSVLGYGYVAKRISVDLLEANETSCAIRGLMSDEYVIVTETEEIRDGSDVFYEGEETLF